MAKNKRLKSHSHAHARTHKKHKLTRPSGITKSASTTTAQPLRKHTQAQHSRPTIPFTPDEHILLVGEGDLSFARALIEHHRCQHVTATVYESESELREKYPHVGENITLVEAGGGRVRFGVDVTRMRVWDREGREKGKGHADGGMDRIMFNFPHVGGKTKDVNRQVRYNQELLVSFFKQALPSLSARAGSSIIVTLFEGEPYTLWNIRDLARHSGLEVAQSFVFQASAYPGYKHVRTLGVVKGKNGEVGAGWKGEERRARSYVFVRKGEGVKMGEGKRKKEESSDEEDEEDDVTSHEAEAENASTGPTDDELDEEDEAD